MSRPTVTQIAWTALAYGICIGFIAGYVLKSAEAAEPSPQRLARRAEEQRFERCLRESKMATPQEDRLTAVNRQLVADLNAARALLRRLIDPEDLGHAVSSEVRVEAAGLLPEFGGAMRPMAGD